MHTKLSFPQGCLIILLKCEFCLEQVSLGGGTQKPSEKVLFCNHIFGETGRNLNMQTFNTLVVWVFPKELGQGNCLFMLT